jgi:hypothetical protein
MKHHRASIGERTLQIDLQESKYLLQKGTFLNIAYVFLLFVGFPGGFKVTFPMTRAYLAFLPIHQ